MGAQGWKPLGGAAYRGTYAPETSYTNHFPRLLPRALTLCRSMLRRRNRSTVDLGVRRLDGLWSLASAERWLCLAGDNPRPDPDRAGFAPVGDVEFLEHARDVEFDGALADSEFLGDGAVAFSHCQVGEDFEFAGVQGGQQVLVRSDGRWIQGDGQGDPASPSGDGFDVDPATKGVQPASQLACEGCSVDLTGPLVAHLDEDVVAVAVPRDPHSGQHRLGGEGQHDGADHRPRRVRHLTRERTAVGGWVDVVDVDVDVAVT